MRKTIEQHFNDIPHDQVKARALANMWWEDADTPANSLQEAIWQGFNWSRSPEGYQYWKKVFDAIIETLCSA